MLTNIRVLVVEAEFLIALDIQRVLEGAHAAETAFARSIDEAAALEPHFTRYNLAIIEMPPDGAAALSLAESLLAAGVAVVLTAADAHTAHETLDPTGVQLISKPFDEAQLLTACVIALATTTRDRQRG